MKLGSEQLSSKVGEMLASEITPADIHGLLRPHATRAPTLTNRVRQYLVAAFNFAMRSEYDINRDQGIAYGVTQNPALPVKPAHGGERVNTLYPSMAELATVWNHVHERAGIETTGAFRFLIASGGQRVQEVTNAKWVDFDLEAGIWTIPTTKMKRPHFVPIGIHMLQVLEETRPFTGGNVCVFPGFRANSTPIDYKSLANALRKLRKDYRMSDWTPRNCRAAAKTHLGNAGVDRVYIDYLQNHIIGSEVGTKYYDKSLRMREKQEAMTAWDRLLEEAINFTSKSES